jgi:hypothetical protein
MIEPLAVTVEELAILCDVVSGGRATTVENLAADEKPTLDRLIANGFVERANAHSVAHYRHAAKTDLLFTQNFTGIKRRLVCK